MNTTKMLTTKGMMLLFAVSHMTIHSWRKNHGLPSVTGENGRDVYFESAAVRKWAKAEKGITVTVDQFNAALNDGKTSKPGPKVKAAPVKASVKPKRVKALMKHALGVSA